MPLAHVARSKGRVQEPPERTRNLSRIQVPTGVRALQEGTRVSKGNGVSWTGEEKDST